MKSRILACVLAVAWSSSLFLAPVSALATQAPSPTPGPTSTCGSSQAIQQAESNFDATTQIADNNFSTVKSLGAISCLQNLLSFGYGLGLSSLSVSGIMNMLENNACQAAQNVKYNLISTMNQRLSNGLNSSSNGYFTVNVNGTGHADSIHYNVNGQAANSIWNALN